MTEPGHVTPLQAQPKFFGKYRGTVQNNVDPLMLGRVIAHVPAVSLVLGWALPCTPYPAHGAIQNAVPPLGANVWIEFEGGDQASPIWTGCFWSAGEAPLLLLPS